MGDASNYIAEPILVSEIIKSAARLGGAIGTTGARAFIKNREKRGKKTSKLGKAVLYGTGVLAGTSVGHLVGKKGEKAYLSKKYGMDMG